ncbi:hypothetical protein SAMN05877809_105164 [Rhodobacter sp. JA431]|nr:hypothetical protein SAMN05877809_105164 [Rhodobacter sp. JA431]
MKIRGLHINLPRRLRRSEEGAVTIPTLFWLPLFLMIMAAGVELGVTTIKQTLFDRGVDMSVRILRLGIADLPTREQLKRSICENIAFIPDCMETLSVEVVPIITTGTPWTAPQQVPALCPKDIANYPTPQVLRGATNQPMLVRACLEMEPMMKANPLGMVLGSGPNGTFPLIARSVFINEPRPGS